MRYQRFNTLDLKSIASKNVDYKSTNEIVKLITRFGINAIYLALDEQRIFKAAPIFKDELIYYDESHINEVGVSNYAAQNRELFEEIVYKFSIYDEMK